MRSSRRAFWIFSGLLVVAVLAGLSFAFLKGKNHPSAPKADVADARPTPNSPLPMLAEGIQRSDEAYLAALVQRLDAQAEGGPKAVNEAEAADWLEVVGSLRAGAIRARSVAPR
jgi:hypothetical protein